MTHQIVSFHICTYKLRGCAVHTVESMSAQNEKCVTDRQMDRKKDKHTSGQTERWAEELIICLMCTRDSNIFIELANCCIERQHKR